MGCGMGGRMGCGMGGGMGGGGGPAPGAGPGRLTGTVKAWYDEKGFGFLVPDAGGKDVFVHRSAITDGQALNQGDAVSWVEDWNNQKGKMTAGQVMGGVPQMKGGMKGGKDEDEDSDDNSEEEVDEKKRYPEGVMKPPPGALHPSLGSEAHEASGCKTCCFFPRGRCMNGYNCEFCHYEHEKRKRKNKEMGKGSCSGGWDGGCGKAEAGPLRGLAVNRSWRPVCP